MLNSLSIRNYALIDSLEVEFPEGLSVISGETGAGKSILLGAISLLAGARSDVSTLGDKSANCVVEGIFTKDGAECIIRRVITPQGRSRAFVNDEPVSLDDLRQTSSGLIDIHAQFDHSNLCDASFQLELLDSYAGITASVKAFSDIYGERCALQQRIARMKGELEEARHNTDYMEFQLSQLKGASLREGELEELEAERRRLEGSRTIEENLSRIGEVFASDESSPDRMLRTLESSLGQIAAYDGKFASLAERTAQIRVELSDIEYEATSLGGKMTFPEHRLEDVEDRIALLRDLMRKHSVSDISSLIVLRDRLDAALSSVSGNSDEIAELEKSLARLDAKCDEASSEIGRQRIAAASSLSASLQDSVRRLEMPAATFEVRVEKGRRTARGDESVEFRFSANEGGAAKPLAKCASGGELSRIMLCIKKLMSEYMGMPTMIFDEIDTGVSGAVADRMGRMIVDMGRNMQVVTITHLPQVASKGSAHFLVYKSSEGGRTSTRLRFLSGEERVREVARMLSGESVTAEAVANARSMLDGN